MSVSERPLRVVAVAPMLDGEDVGEAWSTYHWARLLAERCDLTILTYYKRGRRPATQQLPNVRIVEWRDVPAVGRFERFNSMAKPGYFPFFLRARRWLRRAIQAGESFDIAHQLAPLALRYPSPVSDLGVPWIIGPLAGSLEVPRAFRSDIGSEPWYVRLKRVDEFRIRHDRLLRRGYEGAACVVGVAPYVRGVLGSLALKRFAVESETGILDIPSSETRPLRAVGELRMLFVGRVVPTKGVIYAIRALSQLGGSEDVELDVVGDGSALKSCREEATQLGIADRVHFHGRVARDAVEHFYRRADVLIFPSLKEPSGNVVFESMRHGLPVIACSAGGPGYVVDQTCGVLVPAVTPSQLAGDLSTAIRQFAGSPERTRQLGVGAVNRVKELALWDSKADRMVRLYRDVLAADADRQGRSTR